MRTDSSLPSFDTAASHRRSEQLVLIRVVTGKFLLDLSSTHLPLNVFAHLLHLAKTAVSLCGACSQGLETDEPFLGNRAGTAHAQEGPLWITLPPSRPLPRMR